jgi:hypothetical protein
LPVFQSIRYASLSIEIELPSVPVREKLAIVSPHAPFTRAQIVTIGDAVESNVPVVAGCATIGGRK